MPDGRKAITTAKPGVKKTDVIVENLIRKYNHEPLIKDEKHARKKPHRNPSRANDDEAIQSPGRRQSNRLARGYKGRRSKSR